MKTTDYIAFIIDRLPKGYVFTYADFTTEVNQKEAVIKSLNRMVNSGKIAKLSKGKYRVKLLNFLKGNTTNPKIPLLATYSPTKSKL